MVHTIISFRTMFSIRIGRDFRSDTESTEYTTLYPVRSLHSPHSTETVVVPLRFRRRQTGSTDADIVACGADSGRLISKVYSCNVYTQYCV